MSITYKLKKAFFYSLIPLIVYYYFKDRPKIFDVKINGEKIQYNIPYPISEELNNLALEFDFFAPKQLKAYSITIKNAEKQYHPNLKEFLEKDGLRGRKTFKIEGEQEKIKVTYEELQLEKGNYFGDILITDTYGYQTKSSFSIKVE